MKKNSGLGKFLAGAAVGAGLGVLFAPKSGKETRADIKKKIDEIIEQAKKQKAKKIQKKAEELYKLAVEKGTPVLEKTTRELKEATAEALKKIVAKLEEE